MDLKTVRQRIRDGQIANIDEFERDITLIFAYVPFTSPLVGLDMGWVPLERAGSQREG